MAYQKTQWKDHIEGVQTGTPVNAANMNKIEEGIAAALPASDIVVSSTENGYYLRLPGVLIQWASKTATVPANSGVALSWSFPVAYSNYGYKVFATPIYESVSNIKYAQVSKPRGYYSTAVYLYNAQSSSVDISVNLLVIGTV